MGAGRGCQRRSASRFDGYALAFVDNAFRVRSDLLGARASRPYGHDELGSREGMPSRVLLLPRRSPGAIRLSWAALPYFYKYLIVLDLLGAQGRN